MLSRTCSRMKELDHYFLNLAMVGPAAADIYHKYMTATPVIKTCVYQSLLHPDFSINQFFNAGPIAMFYNNRMMMAEIMYVIMTNLEALGVYTPIYGNKLTKPNHGRHHGNRSDSALSYLAKIHRITRKRGVDILKQLKARLGDRVFQPAYAFSRPV